MKLFFSNNSGPDGTEFLIMEHDGGKVVGKITDQRVAEYVVWAVNCYKPFMRALGEIANKPNVPSSYTLADCYKWAVNKAYDALKEAS